MIPVRDREGDFRGLLARAVDDGEALLVRAGRPAQERVRIPDGEECPWAHVAACKPVAMTGPTIPAACQAASNFDPASASNFDPSCAIFPSRQPFPGSPPAGRRFRGKEGWKGSRITVFGDWLMR